MSALPRQSALFVAPHMNRSIAPHWLTHLGALGLFSVAVVDSSVIPLPLPGSTDLLLLWLVAHSGDPWLLVAICRGRQYSGRVYHLAHWPPRRRSGVAPICAGAPFSASRRLGKAYPALAVFLPALLPPPIPLLPFALASGALGVSRRRFLVVFGAAQACVIHLLHG